MQVADIGRAVFHAYFALTGNIKQASLQAGYSASRGSSVLAKLKRLR
jgi:hypothetical protein